MKHILSITVIILSMSLCHSLSLKSQNIEIGYSYDKSGNCTGRNVITLDTKSSVIDSIDSPKIYEDREINIKIYPNPTKGQLKIEVPTLDNSQTIEIALFSLSGKMILKKKYKEAYVELDLSYYTSGVYILRVYREGKYSSWKIIKID